MRQTVRRAAAAALVASVVGLGLVVPATASPASVPAARPLPAVGWDPGPKPAWFMGSADDWIFYQFRATLPSGAYPQTGSTPQARTNAVIQTRPYTDANGVQRFRAVTGASRVVKAGGAIMAATTGFTIGYEGVNSVMRLIPGIPDENIGVQNLMDTVWPPQKAPGYEINADLGTPNPPGWVGEPVVLAAWGGCSLSGTGGCVNTSQVNTQARVVGTSERREGGTASEYKTYLQLQWTAGPNTVVNTSGQPMWSWLQPHGVTPTTSTAEFRPFGTLAGNPMAASPLWQTGRQYAPGTTQLLPSEGLFRNDLDRVELWQGSKVATYYPVNHPMRPPDHDPNPERAWEVRFQCAAGVPQTRRSASFREGDATWPPIPDADCVGEPLWLELWQVAPNGDAPSVLLERFTPSQGYTNWRQQFPQCSDGSCTLEIARVDPATGAQISCFTNPEACVDWYTSPTKQTDYQCTYAGTVLPIDECRVYAHTFNVATGQPTTNPDGSKRPAEDTSAAADPGNGNPVPKTKDPTAPGTQPATGQEGCPPPFSFTGGGFGYWVTKGTSCALAWAFVPPAAQTSQLVGNLRNGLSSHAPFSVIVAVPGLVSSVGQGWSGGCDGLPNFSTIEGKPLRLPCSPPASSGFTMAYSLMSILLWVTVVFAVWRMAHNAVGGKD